MKRITEYMGRTNQFTGYLFGLMGLIVAVFGYFVKTETVFENLIFLAISIFIIYIFLTPFIIKKRLISSAIYSVAITGNLLEYLKTFSEEEMKKNDPFDKKDNFFGDPDAVFTLNTSSILFCDNELLFLNNGWFSIFGGKGYMFPYADFGVNKLPYEDIKNCKIKYTNGVIIISFIIVGYRKRFLSKNEPLSYIFNIRLKDSDRARYILKEKLH